MNAVQDVLGHADAKMTSTYLNSTPQHLQDSMRQHPAPERPVPAVAQTPKTIISLVGNDNAQPASNPLAN